MLTPGRLVEITENGRTVYKWNGSTFNFKNDAYYHMCDKKRVSAGHHLFFREPPPNPRRGLISDLAGIAQNDCLDAANALPNAQVDTARQTCETEVSAFWFPSGEFFGPGRLVSIHNLGR